MINWGVQCKYRSGLFTWLGGWMRKYFSQNLVVSFCNVPSAIQFLRFKPKILILMIKHIRDPSSVHDCLLLVFFKFHLQLKISQRLFTAPVSVFVDNILQITSILVYNCQPLHLRWESHLQVKKSNFTPTDQFLTSSWKIWVITSLTDALCKKR